MAATPHRSGALALHRDEGRPVEAHEQTQQKLEVVRSYAAAHVNIIANFQRGGFDNTVVYLVDACAGAGLHRSDLHPDGVVLGTALILARVAEAAQAKHPGLRVPVRLIEINPEWAARLNDRLARFRTAGVDVLVLQGDLAIRIPEVLREIAEAGRDVRSLWLIDPDGFAEIPRRALDPLSLPAFGPELLINLDMSGLWRTGVGADRQSLDDVIAAIDQAKRDALDRTFGGASWRSALAIPARLAAQNELARLYGQTWRRTGSSQGFEHVNQYRLRATAGQVRYFIHAAHSSRAETAFRSAFEATNRLTFASRALTQQARGVEALELWRLFAGKELPLDAMLGARPLNRQQLATVVRHAQAEGYGAFDEGTRVMTWFTERVAELTLGLF